MNRIVLDTDNLSVFTDECDPRHELLNRRMDANDELIACTESIRSGS